jgi:hypothetical protein
MSKLVWTIPAIAKAINRSPRQTRELVRKNLIPVKKVNGRHVANQDELENLSTWGALRDAMFDELDRIRNGGAAS